LHSLKIIKTTFTDLTHLFKLFLIALNVRIANNRISNLKNLKTWNRTDHDPIWSSSVRVDHTYVNLRSSPWSGKTAV